MVTVTRILEFDAAHRVMNHESKCANIHGHRYKVEITAHAVALDSVGRVIDFSVIKERVGTWIDEQWDHNIIIFQEDLETLEGLNYIPRKKLPFIAPWNPTAEKMALHLLHIVCPTVLHDCGIKVPRVVVWETPNCWATAIL